MNEEIKEKIINDLLTWAEYRSRTFQHIHTDNLGRELQKEVNDFAEKYLNNQPYL